MATTTVRNFRTFTIFGLDKITFLHLSICAIKNEVQLPVILVVNLLHLWQLVALSPVYTNGFFLLA